MSALGKRYIAVWEYLGPADEGKQWSEDVLYARSPGHTVTNQRRVGDLIVDLDALPRTDFTPEQLAMHAERQALYWAAEFDRLAPCLGGHPPRESETVRMRAVIEAMRPIVERAIAWGNSTTAGIDETDVELGAAIEDNREQVKLALAALDPQATDGHVTTIISAHEMAGLAAAFAVLSRHHSGGYQWTTNAQIQSALDDISRVVARSKATPRPTPCSGCSDDCNCKCGNNFCGCPCHKAVAK